MEAGSIERNVHAGVWACLDRGCGERRLDPYGVFAGRRIRITEPRSTAEASPFGKGPHPLRESVTAHQPFAVDKDRLERGPAS